ncbi:MAG: FAD-dependent oxidoreductase, partial [Porticoccaceae bacterium]|nr:FAD-dependent oxidoreductase [Porticoccaceae bacterium]
MSRTHTHDVLIIGSGSAGLTLALQLAETQRVAVLSKGELHSGSTWLAQGGVAAVLDEQDSIDAHVQDTMTAGAALSHEAAVRFTVSQGRSAIEWLIEQGVPFTRDSDHSEQESDHDSYHLTKEGGHSQRRIIHAADATGKAIQSTLIERARAHQNIDLYEHHVAVDLITRDKLRLPGNRCIGAYVLNITSGH